MKAAFQHAALSCIIALALTPISAHAEEKPSPDAPHEITLDIDHDGKLDRAALVRVPESADADLYIYLGAGAEKLDLSRTPSILKNRLAHGHVLELTSNAKGSLIVKYGCGGCSNDDETSLTIVHRGGEFLVAGFANAWEWRDRGSGGCDINLLTGRGVFYRGLNGKKKPIKATFTPIKLSDWSVEKMPKACWS
jgi:hypothetical protein